jgi:hypothetical protein
MYSWPDWEEMEMFDSDDLDSEGAYLVFDKLHALAPAAYFWVGPDCDLSS